MRFFAIGQEAEGFIAIGQIATGVIAIGQMATGVIAIGQVARGVVAVGMLAFGMVSVGMLSGGLIYAVGMIGAAGRRGPGFILPLVPIPRATPQLPELTTLEAISGSRREGWLRAKLQLGTSGMPELVHEGRVLPVTLAAKLLGAATSHAQIGSEVVARIGPGKNGLRVHELKVLPLGGAMLVGRALQIAALFALAYAYWHLVLVDLGDMLVGTARAFMTGQVQ
ncbi:hypothetical protein [Sandaracinus amylolyticus]|uniref:hypothetical protein n=1 Tax=Sandaracinus amylolyticus TaxID=927083 RepID=UPI001F410B81|nr:hypothetical protein [Sandaracinus amylolyticus]UJR78161.1 Hypothetical protein I5071_1880 [Sandaracinus amylolyticus]